MKLIDFIALPLLLLGWFMLVLAAAFFAFWHWLDDK